MIRGREFICVDGSKQQPYKYRWAPQKAIPINAVYISQQTQDLMNINLMAQFATFKHVQLAEHDSKQVNHSRVRLSINVIIRDQRRSN